MLLVLVEHDRGVLADASLEALTLGRSLAAQLSVPFSAVALTDAIGTIGSVSEACAAYGVAELHVGTHAMLADFGPEAWGSALAQIAALTNASVILATGTDRGNEVLAQFAARADLPFVANCLEITPGATPTDAWSMVRSRWGGSLLEEASLTASVRVLSVAHHGVEAVAVDAVSSPVVISHEVVLDSSFSRTVVVDRVVRTSGLTLSTARVVVGGGRGVGSPEGFAVLEDLAEALGGMVGCSRAVTNNGWRPHTDQVGQTGTRIAPDIYLACGISGAIQHWVGAMASKKILAINTDPEANMVSRADYAVIGDLHTVVPAIAAEVRRRKG
jgi:electron transfer flavoprotein alpha subunit